MKDLKSPTTIDKVTNITVDAILDTGEQVTLLFNIEDGHTSSFTLSSESEKRNYWYRDNNKYISYPYSKIKELGDNKEFQYMIDDAAGAAELSFNFSSLTINIISHDDDPVFKEDLFLRMLEL